MIAQLRERARRLKRDLGALALAARHPGTPWYAKAVVLCVVGYALSPIDLVPDPIPVLGYLDDLVLLPLGIALALRLVPPAVLAECRAREAKLGGRSRWAAVAIVAVWLLIALAGVALALRLR